MHIVLNSTLFEVLRYVKKDLSQQHMDSQRPLEPQRMPAPYEYPTERPAINLMDLIDRILDKGLVIDLYVKINLVGIELLEIQARIVIAGIQSYLRYAEEMQRIGLVSKPYAPRTTAMNQMMDRGGQGRQQQQQMMGRQGQQQQRGVNIPVQGPRGQGRPQMQMGHQGGNNSRPMKPLSQAQRKLLR